jgi:hypothetical protein
MAGFLSAHGYDPGPTQRPLLAGAISGVLATIPAIAILAAFGSLRVEARILGISLLLAVAAGSLAMALAGAVYGRLFGRAANDRHGGWLFAMAFGFALWAGGAVLILPIASGGLAPAGEAAIGLFLALVGWGAALGALFPYVHRPLHEQLETAARRRSVGPDAAASNGRNVRRRPEGSPNPPRP